MSPPDSVARILLFLILALLGSTAHATFQLLQGPLQNRSYTAVPTSLHLGPQSNVTVSGRLRYLPNVDPCAPPEDVSVSGQLVLVDVGACSPERQYDAWADRGVAALLLYGPYQPGGMYGYMRDGVARHAGLVYVQLYKDPDLFQYLDAVAESEVVVDVRLEPDPSPWVELYQSPAYQLLGRFLPAALQAIGSGMAWVFLYRNVAQLRGRYRASPHHHWRPFLKKNFGAAQTALLIRAVTSAVLAAIRAVGGYFSTSNLPGPVQRFFFQELWGVTAVTALIVSSIWNTARQKVAPSRTLTVRLLTGEFRSVSVFMFGFVLVLELVVSLSYATYYFNTLLRFLAILEIVHSLALLSVALQFVTSALQLRAVIRQNPSSSINDYVVRMSRLVAWLGVIMFLLVCTFVIMGAYPGMWNPPESFLVLTLAALLHAAACIVITLLLKPQEADAKKAPTATFSKPHFHAVGSSETSTHPSVPM